MTLDQVVKITFDQVAKMSSGQIVKMTFGQVVKMTTGKVDFLSGIHHQPQSFLGPFLTWTICYHKGVLPLCPNHY